MSVKTKVLCIGVNRLPRIPRHRFKPLSFAEKDARSMAAHFETLGAVAEVTCRTGKDATRAEIFQWLDKCNAHQEELTLVIFFAGHGSAERNIADKKLERCLWINSNDHIPIDEHKIKTAEILNRLDNPSHRLFLIVDACYSFARKRKPSVKDIFDKFEESERDVPLTRYVIISASSINLVAFEDHRIQHGVLAYYFLKALSGKYSFFLSKKLSPLKLLRILDKKLKTHRFRTNTGRRVRLVPLMKNGISAHVSGQEFELPILGPLPFIPQLHSNSIRLRMQRVFHFLTRSRIRRKLLLACIIPFLALSLLYAAHHTIVRIHFLPLRPPTFSNLFGFPIFHLNKLDSQNLGKSFDQGFDSLFFSYNWPDALQAKLNEEGKIIVSGNWLGNPIKGVSDKQLLKFALDQNNSDTVFLWHPSDGKRLLNLFQKQFHTLTIDEKKNALKLMAEMGPYGKYTAVRAIDFLRDTDQELRNMFLTHFCTRDFLEKNRDALTPQDYLFLLSRKKPVFVTGIPTTDQKMMNSLLELSYQATDDISTEYHSQETLTAYGKLKILAYFGGISFRQNACHVFDNTFDSLQTSYLIQKCRRFDDALWLLQQYCMRIRHLGLTEIPDQQWMYLDEYFSELPIEQKSLFKRTIIYNSYSLIPRFFKDSFLWKLDQSHPNVITLQDWKTWMREYGLTPEHVLHCVTRIKYPGIIQFIQINYRQFEGFFENNMLETLYEQEPDETAQLLRELLVRYPSTKDKLCFTLFMYSKDFKEKDQKDARCYSKYILDFINQARYDQDKQNILKTRFRIFSKALNRMVDHNEVRPSQLRYFMDNKNLFYDYTSLNSRLWPEEVRKKLSNTQIPYSYNAGIPFLRACEKLPQPYRKRMLIKICMSSIDETFRINVEIGIININPHLFLDIIFKPDYPRNKYTFQQLSKAYQHLSIETLERRMATGLARGVHSELPYIFRELEHKHSKGDISSKRLRKLLHRYNQPHEKFLLSPLRRYLNKYSFQKSKNTGSFASAQ